MQKIAYPGPAVQKVANKFKTNRTYVQDLESQGIHLSIEGDSIKLISSQPVDARNIELIMSYKDILYSFLSKAENYDNVVILSVERKKRDKDPWKQFRIIARKLREERQNPDIVA